MTNNIIPNNTGFISPNEFNLNAALSKLKFRRQDRKYFVLVASTLKMFYAGDYDKAETAYRSWLKTNHNQYIYKKCKKILNPSLIPYVTSLAPLFTLAKKQGFVPVSNKQYRSAVQNIYSAPADDTEYSKLKDKKIDAIRSIKANIRTETAETFFNQNMYMLDKGLDSKELLIDYIDCKELHKKEPNAPLYEVDPFGIDRTNKVTGFLERGYNQLDKFIVVKRYALNQSRITGYQIIAENGRKTNITYETAPSYGVITKRELNKNSTIVICEGFATAASVFSHYPNKTCIDSGGAENLLNCAQDFRRNFPNVRIEIAGDFDMNGVGQETAYAAAEAIGATLHLPKIIGDWNHVHVKFKNNKGLFEKWYEAENQKLKYFNNKNSKPDTTKKTETITTYNIIQETRTKAIIKDRYLGNVIKDYSKNNPVIAVRAEMGSGKTRAMQMFVDSLQANQVVLYISPRIRLNYAVGNDKDLGFIAYKAGDKIDSDTNRLTTTPLSVAELKDKLTITSEEEETERAVVALIFDESNEISKMLTSRINKSKIKVIGTLVSLCRTAQHTIYMDAFLDRTTLDLISCLHYRLPGLDVTYDEVNGVSNDIYDDFTPISHDDNFIPFTISSTFKPWQGYQLSILSTAKDQKVSVKAARLKLTAEMCKLIERNEPIYIASMSRTFAQRLKKMFSIMYPEIPLIYLAGQLEDTITTDEKKQAEAFLSNPKKYMPLFKIIIATPAIAVGLSFDLKDYIHTTFGIIANNQATGDPATFVQLLARVRDVKSKTFRIVGDLNLPPYDFKFSKKEIEYEHTSQIRRTYKNIGEEIVEINKPFLELSASNEYDKRTSKNRFINEVRRLLNSMKVVIIEDDSLTEDWVKSAETLKKMEQRATGELAEEKRKLIIASRRISLTEARRLEGLAKFAKEALTQSEWAALWRYRLEDNYMVNLDVLSKDELDDVFKMYTDYAIGKIILRENVTEYRNNRSFFKKVATARVSGLGDENYYLADVLSEKHAGSGKMKLYQYPLNHLTKFKTWEASELGATKKHPMFQFIVRNRKTLANIHGKSFNLKRFDLCRNINKLLRDMGFTIKSKSLREGEGVTKQFSLNSKTAIEKLAQKRIEMKITLPDQIKEAFRQIEEDKVKVKDLVKINNAPDPVTELGRYSDSDIITFKLRKEKIIETRKINPSIEQLQKEFDEMKNSNEIIERIVEVANEEKMINK